jgi:hypothetical protein
MEKTVTKRSLKDFRHRENPWKDRSYEDRLVAMAVICGTTQNDGSTQPGLSRVHRITRRGAR